MIIRRSEVRERYLISARPELLSERGGRDIKEQSFVHLDQEAAVVTRIAGHSLLHGKILLSKMLFEPRSHRGHERIRLLHRSSRQRCRTREHIHDIVFGHRRAGQEFYDRDFGNVKIRGKVHTDKSTSYVREILVDLDDIGLDLLVIGICLYRLYMIP